MKSHRTLPAIALGALLLAGCSSESPAEWAAREDVSSTTTAIGTTLTDAGTVDLATTCSGLTEGATSSADLPDVPEESAESVAALEGALTDAATACSAATASGTPEALTAAAESIVRVKEALAAVTGAPEASAIPEGSETSGS